MHRVSSLRWPESQARRDGRRAQQGSARVGPAALEQDQGGSDADQDQCRDQIFENVIPVLTKLVFVAEH